MAALIRRHVHHKQTHALQQTYSYSRIAMLLAMRQAQERIERLEQAIRNRRARRILVECSWSYQHPPGDCHQAFNPE